MFNFIKNIFNKPTEETKSKSNEEIPDYGIRFNLIFEADYDLSVEAFQERAKKIKDAWGLDLVIGPMGDKFPNRFIIGNGTYNFMMTVDNNLRTLNDYKLIIEGAGKNLENGKMDENKKYRQLYIEYFMGGDSAIDRMEVTAKLITTLLNEKNGIGFMNFPSYGFLFKSDTDKVFDSKKVGIMDLYNLFVVVHSTTEEGLSWVHSHGMGQFELRDIESKNKDRKITEQVVNEFSLHYLARKIDVDKESVFMLDKLKKTFEVNLNSNDDHFKNKYGIINLSETTKTEGVKVLRRDDNPDVHFFKKEDNAMNEAMEEAKKTVNQFIKALESKSANYQNVSIKFPFKAKGSDSIEHIWVSDLEFKDGKFYGKLANESINGPQDDDSVVVKKEDISDWMYIDNGVLKGGYTVKVIVNQMKPDEREEFLKASGFRLE